MKRSPIAILAPLLFALLAHGLSAEEGRAGLPPGRLAMLSRCINIDNWFSVYSNPRRYPDRLGPGDFALIAKAGFTAVRLTIAPGVLFDPADPGRPKDAIASVDRAVRLILDTGLGLVFDPMHGSSDNDDFEHSLARDKAFGAKVEAFWESLARRYSALSADRIVFEVMNEPHLSTREGIAASWWPAEQARLAAAIRRGAPANTILATGEKWGSIDGLLALKPLKDPNVLYSFHWYDPFAFTHQGAEWAGAAQASLRDIPYPSSPGLVAAALPAIKDAKAREAAIRYGAEKWDAGRVERGLERAAAWAKANGASVWCGEFGTYKKVAPPADRLRWIADVRTALEGLGIGWAMWEYDQSFGFLVYKDPAHYKGRSVDAACLEALGLSARDLPVPDPSTPLDDFASGASSSLDMPVADWSPLWTRDKDAGSLADDPAAPGALLLTHTGKRDWALSSGYRIPVKAGEKFRLSSRASITGTGSLSLEVVAYDAEGKVLDWSYGRASPAGRDGKPELLASEFYARPGIAAIEPRWSGSSPAEIRLEAMRLEREEAAPRAELPPSLSLESAFLALSLDTADATMSVRDLRCGLVWTQKPLAPGWMVVGARASAGGGGFRLSLVDARQGKEIEADFELDPDRPELEISLDSSGPLEGELAFPQPFVTEKGTRLIVPLNEGISYPADDPSVPEAELVAYGGHGICMSFWGVEAADGRGQMAILETPDDAAIAIRRQAGLLYVQPLWQAQKGAFGYPRRLRYAFFDSGGFVAMCKRYRSYAQERGTLVTLAEKREHNPNVELLVGAADVWCWDGDPARIARSLRDLGMDRMLWSAAASPEAIREMNGMGLLTGRYDIYQDCMDPSQYPKLRYVSQDWTSSGWPRDIVIDRDGNWERGWGVEAKDGSLVPCGVLSDSRALGYAEKRVPADLADHPYRARFVDTTTASPWREDWSAEHPMTRGESREWKMRLLEYMSKDSSLVTGSETGHDAAVPYVHYFEGMMSLGPYRIDDAGRDMQRILGPAPDRIRRFQLGWAYRLPLWELVYHDCVVAYWYWGDYSNKITSVWDLRDLFNCLYGTPPEYMLDSGMLKREGPRFAASYKLASRTARLCAYAEMTDFRILAPDRSVQRSVFSNGISATVNFGKSAWKSEGGEPIAPGGCLIEGVPGAP
jgi:aryl-phospho-beta-D-glucosidase BglC (GH1 family)